MREKTHFELITLNFRFISFIHKNFTDILISTWLFIEPHISFPAVVKRANEE